MMEIWQNTIKWKMWQINQTFTSKIRKNQFEPLKGPKIAKNNKNGKIPSAWGPIFGPRVEIWPKFIKYGCWAIKRWITFILTKSLLGPLRKPQIGFKMNSAARKNWVQLHGAGCGTLQCEWISNIFAPGGSYGHKLSGGTPYVALRPLWRELCWILCSPFLEFKGSGRGHWRLVTFGLSGKHYAGQNEKSFEGHSL